MVGFFGLDVAGWFGRWIGWVGMLSQDVWGLRFRKKRPAEYRWIFFGFKKNQLPSRSGGVNGFS